MNEAQKISLDRAARGYASPTDIALVRELIDGAKKRVAAGEDAMADQMLLRHATDWIGDTHAATTDNH